MAKLFHGIHMRGFLIVIEYCSNLSIHRRDMTDKELKRKVIDVLVSHPPTEDCWKDPIHAVDRVNWKNLNGQAMTRESTSKA